MPGVSVSTATRSGPSAVVSAPSGQFFVVGQAERGSTTPIAIYGIAGFEYYFGGRVTYSHLYDTVKTFFEEGGTKCWVSRVVGPAATKGTLVLNHSTALPTLTVNAKNAGTWSSGMTVTVTQETVNSVLKATVVITYGGVVVGTFTGATPAEIVEASNGNEWVDIIDSGSGVVAPLPIAVSATALSAGTDDKSNIITATYTASLLLFDISLGDGSVAIPGVGSTIHNTLMAHAATNRRIALLDMPETTSVATLKTTALAINNEYAGLFAPWVQIPTENGSRFIPPVGYIAAVRNRAHEDAGAFRAAAGEIATARYLTGLKYVYSRTDADDLDANKVNAIRIITGTVRNYGWRSLSSDATNYSLLTGRDLLNRLVTQTEKELEHFVFQTIDGKGHLLSAVNGTIVGIVEPVRRAGGLYERYNLEGVQIDPGYKVETGSDINPLNDLANNIIKARLSVRISPSAALIQVTIVKVGLLSTL